MDCCIVQTEPATRYHGREQEENLYLVPPRASCIRATLHPPSHFSFVPAPPSIPSPQTPRGLSAPSLSEACDAWGDNRHEGLGTFPAS